MILNHALRLFLLSCIILLVIPVHAQEPPGRLLQAYRIINQKNPGTEGFRVQIHFGNDREKAREVKSEFLSNHPSIEAYESYQSPNFRVRVGNFRNRYEAARFQKEIQSEFTSAFVVRDLIEPSKIED